MTWTTIYLRPLNPKTGQVNWPSQKGSLWRTNISSFCFSLLRKVCPSRERERPICLQQEEGGEPGLMALPAKNYVFNQGFNWEGVTIDYRCTMADGKAMVHHHILLRIIRPEKESLFLWLMMMILFILASRKVCFCGWWWWWYCSSWHPGKLVLLLLL